MNRFVRTVHAMAFLIPCIGGSVLLVGCGSTEPPQFQLNMMEVLNKDIESAKQQRQIATILRALFGTPDEPFVVEETGLDLKKIQVAAGSIWSDQGGQKFGLYREHCAHCHGTTGDGQGPTAAFLNPYPRDYTQGKFKFKSTERTAQPTSEDLHRVLNEGIAGTAMPSFRLLPIEERAALVEYVKYLSMRGEMERNLIAFCAEELDEEDELEASRELLIDDMLVEIAEKWSAAEDQIIHPEQEGAPRPGRSAGEIAQSIEAGRELFYGKRANCFSCHGDTAIGDGQRSEFDDWSKAVKEFEDAHPEYDFSVLGLLPPRPIHPRNLRQGIYRGGGRPVDIFWRVYAGINGTPMPATGPATPGGKGVLTPQEMWQIVDYVKSLPYEPASMPPSLHPTVNRPRL